MQLDDINDPAADERPAETVETEPAIEAGEPDQAQPHPRQRHIDLSRDPTPGVADHALPDGAPTHPLIDLSRDPTPGVANHALPDDEE